MKNEQFFSDGEPQGIQMDASDNNDIEPELLEAGASFRDRTPTLQQSGKRNWLYPHQIKGKFYKYRTYASWLLLAIFFVVPFIKINGNPLFMFNVLERKFVMFGIVFWPQDFYLFALSLLTIAVGAILFTAVFGRIWCGWACPQTVFMEMVFRKIENWIEGSAVQKMKLDKMPWNGEKIRKKALKFSIFYILSFVVGNLLLSYIIGIDKLFEIITDPPSEHIGGLTAMVLFSGLFFWIFSWFREQACTFVCPYGRLQSVLLDKNSIVVAYDHKRGEPRGKFKKKRDPNLGDCVDCNKCVQVCPTSIDIRNGIQLECINCTACMDACDLTMTQVKKPTGLIRYTSENNIESGEKTKFTTRIALYSILLVTLFTIVTSLLIMRKDIDVTVLRTKGTIAYNVGEADVMNMLTVNFINKTNNEKVITMETPDHSGVFKQIGYASLVLKPQDLFKGQFQLTIPAEELEPGMNKVKIHILEDGKVVDRTSVNFLKGKGN